MKHSFDTDHAIAFGVEAAVILYNIDFWLQKNKANQKHFYEERYWTYNSVSAWLELFPYMTKDVIRKRLDLLAKKGILLKGSFNEDRRDRTVWYSIEYSQLHLVVGPNAIGLGAKSSINDSDSKQTDSKPSNFLFDHFWVKYDKKVGRAESEKQWEKLNDEIREKIMAHLDLYTKVEKQFRKDPERYLKHKGWNNEVISNQQAQDRTRQQVKNFTR